MLTTACKFYDYYLANHLSWSNPPLLNTLSPAGSNYTLTYVVSDAAGNINSTLREVMIVDTRSPILDVSSTPVTLEYNTSVDTYVSIRTRLSPLGCPSLSSMNNHLMNWDIPLLGCITAYDTLDGNVSCGVVITVATVPYTSPLLAGSSSNSGISGNSVISPISPLNLNNAGPLYIKNNCVARIVTDVEVVDCSNITIGSLSSIAANAPLGTVFVVWYSVQDYFGNQQQAYRTVTVVDTTPPAFHFSTSQPTYVSYLGAFNPLQFVTAYDIHDGNVTSSIIVAGDIVNTVVPGNYTITYRVSDSHGNQQGPVDWVITVLPEPPASFNGTGVVFSSAYRLVGMSSSTFNVPSMHLTFRLVFVATLKAMLSSVRYIQLEIEKRD